MFSPKFQLKTVLLDNIMTIKRIVGELNNQKFPDLVLAQFEKESYSLSTYASTSIEGNPLPLTEVRKLLKSKPNHIRDTEKEILNYNEALQYLNIQLNKKQPLNHELIHSIQSLVTKELLKTGESGNYRKVPVVVNDPIKRSVAYIPPDSGDVLPLMTELIEYITVHNTDTDPLILAGIFHKQFVIIHPYVDGNGRTTRLLTKYLLAQMGLDTFNLFSFENYYNQNVSKYFKSVGVFGDYYEIQGTIDFTDWLIYFTDGIIDELLRVQKLLTNTLPKQIPFKQYEQVALEYLKQNGIMTKSTYGKLTGRATSTLIKDLKVMVERNILHRHGKGRATYYTLNEDEDK